MPTNVKELIVVWTIASLVFWFAKPVALHFSAESDFVRRRRTWLFLTIVAFLSPSFWIFVLFAVPVLIVAGRRDSNPSALYLLMLHVIPPMEVPVPMIGMPYLFITDNYLILSFVVMTPAALRLLRTTGQRRIQGLQAADYLLLAYGLLTSVLYVRAQTAGGGLFPVTVTDCLRQACVFFFITYIPYFVVSRSIASRQALKDTLATYCLSCFVLAAIAIFESTRHWLLYGEMAADWGYGIPVSLYVLRGESLRAMVSTGHALTLGHLLVIAFAFWLSLQRELSSRKTQLAGQLLIWAGLLAAYSRGPWIAAVLAYFVFAGLNRRAFTTVFRATSVAALVAIVIAFSPLRDRIVNVLPFLGGKVDSYNVDYRERLLDRSWTIIKASPMLGDQTALLKMQDLKQGQGIIDMVNTYVQILLDNGFVGLFLFLAFILVALTRAVRITRRVDPAQPDLQLMGASIIAAIFATLLLLASGSFGTGTARIFFVLAGLAVAYRFIAASGEFPATAAHEPAKPAGSTQSAL